MIIKAVVDDCQKDALFSPLTVIIMHKFLVDINEDVAFCMSPKKDINIPSIAHKKQSLTFALLSSSCLSCYQIPFFLPTSKKSQKFFTHHPNSQTILFVFCVSFFKCECVFSNDKM